MRTNKRSSENDKCLQAEMELRKLMEHVCSIGFFGSASVTINVQDGHIQTTRVAVDRMIR